MVSIASASLLFILTWFLSHLLVCLDKTLIFITLGGNEIGSLIEKTKNKSIVATVAVLCPFLFQSHPMLLRILCCLIRFDGGVEVSDECLWEYHVCAEL